MSGLTIATKNMLGVSNTQTLPVRAVPGTLELVKDAVVFIEGAQLAAEVIMNLQEQTRTDMRS